MPFLDSWGSQDRRTLLHFEGNVLEVFQQHIQRDESDYEAGGILLGSIHGNHILVTEVTIPTQWDKRLRFFFERLPYGHRPIAALRWKRSGGEVRYLGDWHTHPEDFPHPSGIDRIEWGKLALKRKDNRPVLAVIVGRKNLHVELVKTKNQGSVFSVIE